MPTIDIDSDPEMDPEDAIAKVTAESLDGGEASWYLGYGDSIDIGDDAPNHITVETAPFEEDMDD